jgi:hypothetical protein
MPDSPERVTFLQANLSLTNSMLQDHGSQGGYFLASLPDPVIRQTTWYALILDS